MIQHQVKEFHQVSGTPVLDKPATPSDDRMRLRAKLIAEEFFEFMESVFQYNDNDILEDCKHDVAHIIAKWPLRIDLPSMTDALADMLYVIHGTALESGIDITPVAATVHTANMAKFPGGKVYRREDGKIAKPPGWTPPDIEQCLLDQGWKPEDERWMPLDEITRIRLKRNRQAQKEPYEESYGTYRMGTIDSLVLDAFLYNAFGLHTEEVALTDRSQVGDFPNSEAAIRNIKLVYGINATTDSFIVDIATRIAEDRY